MDQMNLPEISPYRVFSREDWALLRADTPMTLTGAELDQLRALNDPVSLEEIEQIYLPLSRLLALYVAARPFARRLRTSFDDHPFSHRPIPRYHARVGR